MQHKIWSGEKDVYAWRWIQFRVSLGFEVQLRDLIKTMAVFNYREISWNFKFSWPNPSKNHCFHEIICIAYTNGPPGLEVTYNQKKREFGFQNLA